MMCSVRRGLEHGIGQRGTEMSDKLQTARAAVVRQAVVEGNGPEVERGVERGPSVPENVAGQRGNSHESGAGRVDPRSHTGQGRVLGTSFLGVEWKTLSRDGKDLE